MANDTARRSPVTRTAPRSVGALHSLPESKRYPASQEEYATILARHHALLDQLGSGGQVLCPIDALRGRSPTGASYRIDAPATSGALAHGSAGTREDVEMAIYATESHHPSEELDALIRAVVDEELVGMIIVPPSGACLYHPYDGGADVIAPTPRARDAPIGALWSLALDAPDRALSRLRALNTLRQKRLAREPRAQIPNHHPLLQALVLTLVSPLMLWHDDRRNNCE